MALRNIVWKKSSFKKSTSKSLVKPSFFLGFIFLCFCIIFFVLLFISLILEVRSNLDLLLFNLNLFAAPILTSELELELEVDKK